MIGDKITMLEWEDIGYPPIPFHTLQIAHDKELTKLSIDKLEQPGIKLLIAYRNAHKRLNNIYGGNKDYIDDHPVWKRIIRGTKYKIEVCYEKETMRFQFQYTLDDIEIKTIPLVLERGIHERRTDFITRVTNTFIYSVYKHRHSNLTRFVEKQILGMG